MAKDAHQDEAVVRKLLPLSIPENAAIHLKYRPATDVLTVLVGNQNRWSARVIRDQSTRIYLDNSDKPVRIELANAGRVLPREWLVQHERGGRSWRRRLGFP